MKRNFLNMGEIAIFRANEGEESFSCDGPCESIADAWQRATKGHDAEHISTVFRLDMEAGRFDDVTDECAAALAYWIACEDPISSVPAFVDQDEVSGIIGGIQRDYRDMRMQGGLNRAI